MRCISCAKHKGKYCENCVVERELDAWKCKTEAPLTPGECIVALCRLDPEELEWVANKTREIKEKQRDEMLAAYKRGEHICDEHKGEPRAGPQKP